ncbi:MAG: hypothetical protein WBC04_17285 [Candidatus Acidiferrales bacterium]
MRTRLVVFALALVGVSAGLGAAEDPLIGTWKLNLAKSKFSPGPPPQGEILKFEPYGDNGIKVTAQVTDAQGKAVVTEYSGSFDGKDVPVTGTEDADTASMKRINASTTERTYKKAGKVTTTARRVVSKDGKTLTVTSKGTNAKGQPVNNVSVFDKQ